MFPVKFSAFEEDETKYLQPQFRVELKNRVYAPNYEVQTAFEIGIKDDQIANTYTVSTRQPNCITAQGKSHPNYLLKPNKLVELMFGPKTNEICQFESLRLLFLSKY